MLRIAVTDNTIPKKTTVEKRTFFDKRIEKYSCGTDTLYMKPNFFDKQIDSNLTKICFQNTIYCITL